MTDGNSLKKQGSRKGTAASVSGQHPQQWQVRDSSTGPAVSTTLVRCESVSDDPQRSEDTSGAKTTSCEKEALLRTATCETSN